jgi:hypothetical protein
MSGDLPVPMMLAQRVLDLFDQCGATPREQNAALDIAKTVVLEHLYPASGDRPSLQHSGQ